MYLTESFGAGETKRFVVPGRFLLLVQANDNVSVELFRDRAKLGERVENVTSGFSVELPDGFDTVEIYSATAQTVILLTSAGKVGFSDSVSIAGVVTAQAKNGTPTQAAATVTNSSGTLLAANANRRYVLIQNKDSAGSVFLNFAGDAATVANGVRIGPGQSFESSASWLTAANITAIGDIASNANIVTVWGS